MTWAIAAGVALALLLGGCGGSNSSEPRPETQPKKPKAQVDTAKVAAALRQGPFREPLAKEFRVKGLRGTEVADPAAAERVDAVELVVETTRKAPPGTRAFAHLELYPTPLAAVERGRAKVALLKRKHGKKLIGGVLSYCAPANFKGQRAWECGGTQRRIFVEATVSPRGHGPHHQEPSWNLALSLMGAMLNYAFHKGA